MCTYIHFCGDSAGRRIVPFQQCHISFSDQSYLILSYLISWCMFRTRSLIFNIFNIDTTLENNNNMYIELQQIIKFYLTSTAVLRYKRACRTRWRVAMHPLGLGLGLRRGRGKQERRGRLTSLDVPLRSTSCWEFIGHLISLSCTHVIEEGKGVLVIVPLWSPPCRVPTSLNEGRGDDVAALWPFVVL